MRQEELDELIKVAKKSTVSEQVGDEFDPYDASGGQCDDAYYMGQEDGIIIATRSFLELLEIRY